MSHELDIQVAELLKMRWKDEDLFIEMYKGRLQISYVYRHRNDIREFSPSTRIEDAMELLPLLGKMSNGWWLQINIGHSMPFEMFYLYLFSPNRTASMRNWFCGKDNLPQVITEAFITAKANRIK